MRWKVGIKILGNFLSNGKEKMKKVYNDGAKNAQ